MQSASLYNDIEVTSTSPGLPWSFRASSLGPKGLNRFGVLFWVGPVSLHARTSSPIHSSPMRARKAPLSGCGKNCFRQNCFLLRRVQYAKDSSFCFGARALLSPGTATGSGGVVKRLQRQVSLCISSKLPHIPLLPKCHGYAKPLRSNQPVLRNPIVL